MKERGGDRRGTALTRGNRELRDWFADSRLRGEDLNFSGVPAEPTEADAVGNWISMHACATNPPKDR